MIAGTDLWISELRQKVQHNKPARKIVLLKHYQRADDSNLRLKKEKYNSDPLEVPGDGHQSTLIKTDWATLSKILGFSSVQ